jgi:WD40 repeat protein
VYFKSDTDVRTPYKRIDGDDLEPSKEIEKENKMLFDDI